MTAADGPLVQLTRSGHTTTITLNRPDKLNAITPAMLHELVDALTVATTHPLSGVIVLTGAGRAFSAGVDLVALGDVTLTGGAVGDLLDVPARRAIALLTDSGIPSIARINGACFTGALELALACDLQVASQTAKMGDTHAKFGLRPTWGMSQRLVSAVGITRAREISLTARTFTGAEAADWNLITRAVPAEELDSTVDQLAATLASNSAASIAAYKDLFAHRLDLGLTDGLGYEASTAYDISDTDERIDGFRG